MISRLLLNRIESDLGKGKVIIILGPRQVGKTTLVKSLASKIDADHLYLNGDLLTVQELLKNRSQVSLNTIILNKRLVVIDEAQRIEEIGLKFCQPFKGLIYFSLFFYFHS